MAPSQLGRLMTSRARCASGLLLMGVALSIAGCFNPFDPARIAGDAAASRPPSPSDPTGLMRLYEWCYNHRAYQEYTELFTADYRFVFSANDTNGNAYRDVPFTREDELISTGKLFSGGEANQPAASTINLVFDRRLGIFLNPYRGNTKWHRTVTTTVVLSINFTDGTQTEVRGQAEFWVVRGDSAIIPDELLARGFEPDSNRWYIERWEDRTLADQITTGPNDARAASATRPAGGQSAAPYEQRSWGYLKAFFRR